MQIQKEKIRQAAYKQRQLQSNRTQLSKQICQRVVELSLYRAAKTVMCYINSRLEVETDVLIQSVLNDGKRCVIPYCTFDDKGDKVLGLWLFEDFNELTEGMWGILEPPKSRWYESNKMVAPESLDLVIAPGLAFSCNGARLGHGAGYYDRLFNSLSDSTQRVGICFETQLFQEIMMEPHDQFMHWVVTESKTYKGCRL